MPPPPHLLKAPEMGGDVALEVKPAASSVVAIKGSTAEEETVALEAKSAVSSRVAIKGSTAEEETVALEAKLAVSSRVAIKGSTTEDVDGGDRRRRC